MKKSKRKPEDFTAIEKLILDNRNDFTDSIDHRKFGITLSSGKNIMFGTDYSVELTELEFILYTFLLTEVGINSVLKNIKDYLIGEDDEVDMIVFGRMVNEMISAINKKIPKIKDKKGNEVFKLTKKDEVYRVISPEVTYLYGGKKFQHNSVTGTLSIDDKSFNDIDETILNYILRFVKKSDRKLLDLSETIGKGPGSEGERLRINAIFNENGIPFEVKSNLHMYFNVEA